MHMTHTGQGTNLRWYALFAGRTRLGLPIIRKASPDMHEE